MTPEDALIYSHGIFNVLRYSSQAAPKAFDRIASSSGAYLLDPMYRTIPNKAPNHVSNRKPTHGSTKSATPV